MVSALIKMVSALKKLTKGAVAKLLNAKGLKASPPEIEQLTRMMNEDLDRRAEQAAARAEQTKAVDRFFEELWAPVRKEERAAARKKKS
jgi:hypothetical protein